MALSWTDDERAQVEEGMRTYPIDSGKSLELQLLQQFELLAWARNPAQYPPRSRAVFDLYLEFLRSSFPDGTDRPLYEHLPNDVELERTAGLLGKFREHLLRVGHLTADLLEKVTAVGVRARVEGSAFRFPGGGKPQVFARSVELLEPADDGDAD